MSATKEQLLLRALTDEERHLIARAIAQTRVSYFTRDERDKLTAIIESLGFQWVLEKKL